MRNKQDGLIRPLLGAVIGLIVMIALGLGLWVAGVVFSDTYGKGEQHKQINDAQNRTGQYQHFFDLYAAVKSYHSQLIASTDQAEQFRKSHIGIPDNAFGTNANEQARLDSIVTGIKNQCAQAIQTYDADAHEFTRRKFLDSQLPESLAESDYCEVSK